MTAAPADPATHVFWRPSAALQVAHSHPRSRRVAQAIVAAICAFTIILTTAPAAFALGVSIAETGVAAQTFTAHTPIGAETAGSPTGVGENGPESMTSRQGVVLPQDQQRLSQLVGTALCFVTGRVLLLRRLRRLREVRQRARM